MQEHWLWDFQKHEIQSFAADKDFYIKCHDSTEPLTGFNLPRGQKGEAILWTSYLSSKVKKLDCGNERIICVELSGNDKICIINVYLPTNNSSVNSHIDYAECLDVLDNIISKHRNSHKVTLCGDFNGTLLSARPYNKHDRLLRDFVREHELYYVHTDKYIFFHHAGTGRSQIDYIIDYLKLIILCQQINIGLIRFVIKTMKILPVMCQLVQLYQCQLKHKLHIL